jgi:hypothetical protein
MSGQDVRALQRALHKAGVRNGSATGHFKHPTKRQVIAFQKRHGIHPHKGTVGPGTWKHLQPYFDGFDKYLVEHVHIAPAVTDKLDHFVKVAWWYYYHRPLHYLQQRPMEDTAPPPNIDSYLDCSELVNVCAKAAGLPDPSGYDPPYQGYGNTDSYLANMRHINLSQVQKGDLSFYSNPGHVGIVVGHSTTYNDFMVIEHGSEGGPDYTSMHYREPVAFTTWRSN